MEIRSERLGFTSSLKVKNDLEALRRKLGLRTRSDLVLQLIKEGLERYEQGGTDV